MKCGIFCGRGSFCAKRTSATSIVAACSRSFRLMRSRTQFAPQAQVRSLTSRTHPRKPAGCLGKRAFPKEYFHSKPFSSEGSCEGVQRATAKPSGINRRNLLQVVRAFASVLCATQGGLNGSKTLAPLNPFGTQLLETFQVENSLFLFFKREPLHPKGCGEGVQRATAKPSGINRRNLLQVVRAFASVLCATQGGFPIAPLNPFGAQL